MRTQSAKAKKVIAYIQANPSASYVAVAKKFKMSPSYVYKLRSNNKPVNKSSTHEEAVDKVNHPPHYKVGGIETIDFIEAKKLNYNLGNVIKYITRADHKGSRNEDLQKALWYLNRELGRKA
jgi:hypothetical protein